MGRRIQVPALVFPDQLDPKTAKVARLIYETMGRAFQDLQDQWDNDPRMKDQRVANALRAMEGDVRLDKARMGADGDVLYLIDGGRQAVWGSSANPAPTGGGTLPSVAGLGELGIYGDGVMGNMTLDGTNYSPYLFNAGTTYTATLDVYANNLTVPNGSTLDPGGYRIFVKNTLTNAGLIEADGLPGGAGANGQLAASGVPAGGAGGSATSALTAGNGTLGGTGRPGTKVAGASGTNTVIAIGEGGNGGAGGGGENSNIGTAGGAVGATQNINIFRVRSTADTLWVVDYSTLYLLVQGGNGGGGGASGAGTGGAGNYSGAGGGGGSGAHIAPIWARYIVNSGTIRANGGAGGKGGNAFTAEGAGGGGGGGGGGFLWLYYDTLANSGTIQAAGGAGGAPGTAGGWGGPLSAGANGASGNIVKFCRLTGVFS